jgi:predicted kinase
MMIIITGLPGTGKTTLAQALVGELKAVHLNTDMVREAMGRRGQYDPETKQAVYKELLRRVEQELREGRSVIIDGTFYLRRLREPFIRLARRLKADIRWIELRAEESTIRDRVGKPRSDSEADFKVYQQIRSVYEPLNRAHLVLWSDQLTVAEMTRRTKDFLMLTA